MSTIRKISDMIEGIEIVSEDVPPSVAPPTSSVVEMTPAEEMIDPEVAAALAELDLLADGAGELLDGLAQAVHVL